MPASFFKKMLWGYLIKWLFFCRILFEGSRGRCLYTGDIRLSVENIRSYSELHDPVSSDVKPITSLYIDTTFSSSKYLYIPHRNQSLDKILTLTSEWVKKSPNHHVHLLCPGKWSTTPHQFFFCNESQSLAWMKIWEAFQ